MEVLSDILGTLRTHGSVYFCDRRNPPWTMAFTNPETASFHLVRRGECWLSTANSTEKLGPGDLVFVESGLMHKLSSAHPHKSRLNSATEILLMCGYCRFDTHLHHPLIKNLQGVIVIRGEELLLRPGLKSILELLGTEFTSGRPGSEIVVNKLTEILLVELIRINFGRSPATGFIAALTDKQIAKALEQLHAAPHVQWTLEKLAGNTGMSRASLANRFKLLVGQTMFEYLTELRMQRARELLRMTGDSVYKVANKVGYASDLAFTKTFRRVVGMTPVAYRKNAQLKTETR